MHPTRSVRDNTVTESATNEATANSSNVGDGDGHVKARLLHGRDRYAAGDGHDERVLPEVRLDLPEHGGVDVGLYCEDDHVGPGGDLDADKYTLGFGAGA